MFKMKITEVELFCHFRCVLQEKGSNHRGQYGYLGRDVGDDLFFFLEITPENGVILTSKCRYTATRL